MPPGSKKRKAAKRKKELAGVHPDSPTSASFHGNGGRDEDEHLNDSHNGNGSESPSPMSQDDHPLRAEEEEEEETKTTESSRDTHEILMEGGSEDRPEDVGECLPPAKKPEEEEPTAAHAAAAEFEREEGNSPPPPPPISTSTSAAAAAAAAAVPIFDPEVVTVEHAESEKAESVGGSLEEPALVEHPTERLSDMLEVEGATDLATQSVVVVVVSKDVAGVSNPAVAPISEEMVQVSDVLVGNVRVESTTEEPSPAVPISEEKVVPLSGVAVGQPRDDAQSSCPCTQNREIAPSTEPQVTLSHHAERRASWMSCCGLFDAFMGPRR